jgi:hypothetical protein
MQVIFFYSKQPHKRILTRKQAEKIIIFTLALTMFGAKAVFAANFDTLGWKIISLLRQVGKWTCIGMASFEIVKKALSGDTNNVFGILIKYLILFGTLYAVPEAFQMVEDVFK